ncbi:MAG: hypothetical protein A2087_07020 [Spirochaetes bacterium GWD1_61_31]|nr:MAG: hypothetical protein A2Y37_08450 [Spirochaetes bacterium GWB1_60_80]OHD28481.1 MAG: hypothetical protein A2004_14805 [Spirochaetes bacterium GWC1_61_12]OHD40097.1 MAG: hypothetical protein A2087_07020 [Spirochaetes bacterium GWD1_61_31]OHD45855.1 MAG: hypothetical protein A2Y35_04085 [Spirochaetes bacterium GWE1_60_18]OHD58398.1 MAG: hypothetical protein A2Y32_06475 [Spirochaetes bacterium GWF1_60_12]HAW85378.1 alpha-galactosidase [Spirochaetaceae bacterium]
MWIQTWSGRLEYLAGGEQRSLEFGGRVDQALPADLPICLVSRQTPQGTVWQLTSHFDQPVSIVSLACCFDYSFVGGDTVFMNGYQSWTDSREFDATTRLKPPSRFLKPLMAKHRLNRYGDYDMVEYSNKAGDFHGFSYAYVRTIDNDFRLIGSLDERSGFTILKASMFGGRIEAIKDLAGASPQTTAVLLSLLFSSGGYDQVFDHYFAALDIKPPRAQPRTGWTSWYNYYQNISEAIILRNLAAFSSRRIPIEVFQIDDGFQTAVGDWLSIQEEFPHGMGYIAERIRQAGFAPGLWLAPFVCETKSAVFRDHQDWIVRDAHGQLVDAGGNWSGFYCLNLELNQVRDYLRQVFRTVLTDWGFQLVKLDFLYAACIQPHSGKTRGQLMCEAMDFLREVVGDRQILGCGVPLWPAFGKVDYCRIGTDVDLQWDNVLHRAVAHRERPSTVNSLENAIGRRHLDGRAFVNDPDVFLLRHDNIKLNRLQRQALFVVNALFGKLLFTSDDLDLYGKDEMAAYLGLFPFTAKRIEQVDCVRHFYKASFTIDGQPFRLLANFSAEKRYTTVERSMFCLRGGKPLWLAAGDAMVLDAFESLVCRVDQPDHACQVLGSTASIFPGSEVSAVRWLPASAADQLPTVELDWRSPVLQPGTLYLKVPAGIRQVRCGGQPCYTNPMRTDGISGELLAIEIKKDEANNG